jgi:hypothetical protein
MSTSLDTVPEANLAESKSNRLKSTDGTLIIEEFKSGRLNADYECVVTKVPNKFIVRPRTAKLTDDQLAKLPDLKPIQVSSPPLEELDSKPLLKEAKKSEKVNSFDLQVQLNSQMLHNMQELEGKYKKLKHKIFDEDEEEPQLIEKSAADEAQELGSEVIEDDVVPRPLSPRPDTRQRPVRQADLLNYKRFGF